jgi:hypothetical protein
MKLEERDELEREKVIPRYNKKTFEKFDELEMEKWEKLNSDAKEFIYPGTKVKEEFPDLDRAIRA